MKKLLFVNALCTLLLHAPAAAGDHGPPEPTAVIPAPPVRPAVPAPAEPARGSWVEVRLPDDRRAWVRAESLVVGSWQPRGPRELVELAGRFVGVPYRYGGVDPNGYDCSGYVQEVFRLAGHHLPRMADAQYDALVKVAPEELAPGDLVFFNTDGSGISHVGIVTAGDRFLHASSSRGVVESGLEEEYYAERFVGAGRLVEWSRTASVEAAEKKEPPSRFEDS